MQTAKSSAADEGGWRLRGVDGVDRSLMFLNNPHHVLPFSVDTSQDESTINIQLLCIVRRIIPSVWENIPDDNIKISKLTGIRCAHELI